MPAIEFTAGKDYRNASGQFRVVSVGEATIKLEYSTGPQAGRVLTKRTADVARLATSEAPAAGEAAAKGEPDGAAARPRAGRKR